MTRTPVYWANLISRRQLEMWAEEWATMDENHQYSKLAEMKARRIRHLEVIHRNHQ